MDCEKIEACARLSYKNVRRMPLPSLPSTFVFNTTFPYPEGNQLEFKKQNVCKLAETLCGFLNSNGGHYIIGINDDGLIVGIKRKNLDEYMRHVDHIISTGGIVNSATKDYVTSKHLSCAAFNLEGAEGKYILVCTANPDEESQDLWQVSDTIIYRMNASNRRVSVVSTSPAIEIRCLKNKLAVLESSVLSLAQEARHREVSIMREKTCLTKERDLALEMLYTSILESKYKIEKMMEKRDCDSAAYASGTGFFSALSTLICC